MEDRLEEIVKNTRGTFECLIDFGMRSTETDLMALREGFEAVVTALAGMSTNHGHTRTLEEKP